MPSMLYHSKDESDEHNLGGKNKVVVMHPDPASPHLVTPEDHYAYCLMECADIEQMAMLRRGTIPFHC